ncbi:winged helix DNA-binding domain-containing protein [Angustibacter speluncae]
MPRTVDVAQRRARLARRQLLLPDDRTDDLPAIADDLVVLHSSDPVTVYLSLLVRMRTPSLVAVERALYEDRSLVRHHAMRRTLWVGTPEVVRTVHAAATRAVAAAERRRNLGFLAQSGFDDPERWLDDATAQVLATLREHGPMTARELGRRVPALTEKVVLGRGSPNEAQVAAHTRVLLQLGFDGALVRTRPTGTWVNGQYTWAAMDDWLEGGVGDLDEAAASADLADRWLRRFGPGTADDLRWWAGWTVARTRRALADAAAVEVDLDGVPGWVAAGDDEPVDDPGPWTALLPGLDPTVMGWKQRDWYLPEHAADAFDRNGNGGPTIWVDGRVVGYWAQRADGTIGLHWFEPVPAPRRREVEERADQVREWLGATRFSVRFPGRVHAEVRG